MSKFLVNIRDKLKKIKHLDILVVCAFLGILLLVYFVPTAKNSGGQTGNSIQKVAESDYVTSLCEKTEEMVRGLSGVESARVMIYFDTTETQEIAYTEEEKTLKDGEHVVTKSPVLIEKNGEKNPIVLKTTYPEPCAVVVVARGAENPQVKLEIMRLVQTLFKINANKIEIFAGG